MNKNNLISNFNNRLREIINDRKVTLASLSERTNIGKSTLSEYLSGKYEAKQDKLAALSNELDVSPLWLMGYDVPKELLYSTSEGLDRETVRVPLIGNIKAVIPFVKEEFIDEYTKVNSNLINKNKTYYSLRVSDDSMFPELEEGDVLLIERTHEFKNGDICVVMVNDSDATLKRIYKNEEGIEIVPKNPNYPSKKYTKQEVQALPITIIGVVDRLIDRKF